MSGGKYELLFSFFCSEKCQRRLFHRAAMAPLELAKTKYSAQVALFVVFLAAPGNQKIATSSRYATLVSNCRSFRYNFRRQLTEYIGITDI